MYTYIVATDGHSMMAILQLMTGHDHDYYAYIPKHQLNLFYKTGIVAESIREVYMYPDFSEVLDIMNADPEFEGVVSGNTLYDIVHSNKAANALFITNFTEEYNKQNNTARGLNYIPWSLKTADLPATPEQIIVQPDVYPPMDAVGYCSYRHIRGILDFRVDINKLEFLLTGLKKLSDIHIRTYDNGKDKPLVFYRDNIDNGYRIIIYLMGLKAKEKKFL